MRIHVLQHVPFEGPARIADWAKTEDHSIATTRLYANDPIPTLNDFDFLVVMGGPMGANDDSQFSWMKSEKSLIGEAISSEKNVLGVCLGAQLIASVCGAKVYRNREKEIGWFPIELNLENVQNHPLSVFPQRGHVFHWHGDTFDLPQGSKHLARSRACENQAFALGKRVLGLQFHLEVDGQQIESFIRAGTSDLTPGEFVQQPSEMLNLVSRYLPDINHGLSRMLSAFSASSSSR